MFTETSLWIGNTDQAIKFYDWCHNYANEQEGWMNVVHLRLKDISDVTEYDQSLVTELAARNLTDGVLLNQMICDDETDCVKDIAWDMGLHVVADNKWDFAVDECLSVYDGCIRFRSTPFRLRAWAPVKSTHGHTADCV